MPADGLGDGRQRQGTRRRRAVWSECQERLDYAHYDRLKELPEVNLVYVVLPNSMHAEFTVRAARAGKHVLCEKPMALNVAECDRMIDACRSNDVKLGVAYYRHFYPAVRRMKELIDSGELGVPVVVQVNAFEWFESEPASARSWLLEQELSGGGPMFDFGCHRIEVLVDLLGDICDIKSTLGNAFFDREVEDVAIANFQFDRGTCGTLAVTHGAREPQDTFDLFFTNGSIHIPVLNEGTMRVLTKDGERIETHPNHPNIHQPLIEDFARAVLENRDPIVTGEIGRRVAAIEQKIYT